MMDRHAFIDAVGGIDVDLLCEHITRKIPTRAQKIRRYLMAAAAYTAAVIAVAVILPFIIGKGDDPAPVPGDDPIAVETHSPVPEDPDLTEINVTDINRVYNGVDTENLPVNVSLDEVNAIISAAVQAYEDYDIVVLENGDRLRTLPKDPHITFSELGVDGMMTDAAMEYMDYNRNVLYVIRDALVYRFPEDARFLTSDIESGEDLLIMDVEAMREYERRNEENSHDPTSISPDRLVIQRDFVQQISFRTIGNDETVLYPSKRDLDIFNILKFGNIRSGEMDPMATASADGLELSVFMTDLIAIDPDVSFTVVLENTGDTDVTLWQGYLGDYIDEVTVYENGVIRPDKSTRSGYSEAIQTRVLKPGEYIIYHDAVSMTNEDDTPAVSSAWECEAKVEYILNGGDEHKTLTVRVNLLRDAMENTVPDPDTITVGAAPPATTPPPSAPAETAVTVYEPFDAPEQSADVPASKPAMTVTTEPPEENPAETTTARKPSETTEKVTYPDPYESNKTATSVTKTFYGCNYTLSVDKAKCEPGDIITVTVSLENKGQSRIDLYDYYYSYDRWNGVTHKNFLDRVAFKVAGIGAYDYSGEGYTKRTSLMPGETMSYTTKIDTTDAYVKSSWAVVSEIYFAVDGEMYCQNNSLLIEHDGCVNWPSDVDIMYNPFDNTRYENAFKGNGEIVITFSPEASKYWEKYLGPEYFGYYGLDDPGSDSPVYFPQFDPYEIEEIKLHEDTTGQCVTVSIFLKDKDEFNVNNAIGFLHLISKENDGAIVHAYPVQANYFVK